MCLVRITFSSSFILEIWVIWINSFLLLYSRFHVKYIATMTVVRRAIVSLRLKKCHITVWFMVYRKKYKKNVEHDWIQAELQSMHCTPHINKLFWCWSRLVWRSCSLPEFLKKLWIVIGIILITNIDPWYFRNRSGNCLFKYIAITWIDHWKSLTKASEIMNSLR